MKRLDIIILIISVFGILSCAGIDNEGGVAAEARIELAVPAGLAIVEYSDNSVKMSWGEVNQAKEYRYKLYATFHDASQKADSLIAIGITAGTFKTIWDLDYDCAEKGFRYWFSVSAVSGSSASEYCEAIMIEPGGIAPWVPENVECVSYTEKGLTFSWQPAEGAVAYEYQLLSKSDDVILTGETQDCQFTCDDLKKGRYYYFQVRSVNDVKTSVYSDKIEGLTYGQYCPALSFKVDAEDYIAFKNGSTASVDDGLLVSSYQTQVIEDAVTLELVSDDEPEAGREYYVTIPSQIDGHYLPYSYVYAENVFDNLPLWAYSASTDLEFKTYMGMLSLNILPDNPSVLKRLSIRSDNDIAGTVVSHTDDGGQSVTVEGSTTIDMSFGDGLTVGKEGAQVYLPVPSGNYDRLFVTLTFDYNFPIQVQLKNIELPSGTLVVKDVNVQTQTTAPETFTVPLSFEDGWPFTSALVSNLSWSGDLYTLNWNDMLVPFKICRGKQYKYQYVEPTESAEGRLQLKKDNAQDDMTKWIMVPGMGGRYISSVTIENTQSSTRKFTFKSSLKEGSLGSLSVKKNEMTSRELVNPDGDRLLNDGEDLYILMDYNTIYYITELSVTYSTIK